MIPPAPGLLAHKANGLLSLPEAAERLAHLLNSPYATNGEIGEAIIHDPGLTARILRLANGHPQALPGTIDTVSGALAVLGRDAVGDVARTTPVARLFRGIASDLVDMEKFWTNSIACAVVARSLAFRCRALNTEPLFIAGLLHKIGRLALLASSPALYSHVLNPGIKDEDALNREEFRVFGFNHARAGAELLRAWGLPPSLHLPVAHYLSPGQARLRRRSAALIHVASALAGEIEPAIGFDETHYRRGLSFERGAWDRLGLSLDCIQPVLAESSRAVLELFELMQSPRGC